MTAPKRLMDRKREDILQAAIAEFRANGFEATSMDKIAASANVSKRTVYNHFAHKEALFEEILYQLWKSGCAQVDVAYSRQQPLRQQLLGMMRHKMTMLNDDNLCDLARIALAATIHSPERAQEMVARLSDKEETLTAWIRGAQQDGRLKPVDPVFATHQLHGLVKAFAFWPQITMGKPKLTPEEGAQVVESAVDMFLSHYSL